MNRLIIVGNGFDLAHGLKTSYADFIDWYFGERIKGFENNYTNIDEDRLCKFVSNNTGISWKKFYDNYSSRYEGNNNKDIIDIIKNDNIYKNNFKVEQSSLFERIIKDVENKGWVDIETDYYEMLKQNIAKVDEDERIKACKELNKQMDFLQEKLIEYLIIEQNKFNKSYFKKDLQEKIYEGLDNKDMSIEFHRRPMEKDKDEQNSKKFGYGDNRVVLLNFNYTNIADKYIKNQYDGFSIIHIHGELNDENSVIFGYGDELDNKYKEIEDLNNNEFLNKIKSVKYLERDNYRKLLSFLETAPFQVYVMGHSCGNSDRTLLNTIFEHENCVSIKPFYYKKPDGTDNFTEIVQNITRNFKDKKLLRDRVVNKMYCKTL